MSFDSEIFLKAPTPSTQAAHIISTEKSIFMKPVMFWRLVGLLVLQILTLVFYCFSLHKKVLPRMSMTIASAVSDVMASHATQIAGASFEDRKRCGYGCFVGTNGVLHVGIVDVERA